MNSKDKNIHIFIVAHNQELIVDFHHKINREFLSGVQYYYILVGENPDTSYLRKFKEVDERTFTPYLDANNIEKYRNLLTYTAWYYIANSNVFNFDQSDYIGIFEYDVSINRNMVNLTQYLEPDKLLSFIPMMMNDKVFLSSTPGLIKSIDKVFDVDIKNIINKYYSENKDELWGATTNHIMPFNFLCNFVDWYFKLIPEIFSYENYPHFHERAIKIYEILAGYSNHYMPEYLTHEQRNSHGIKL